MVEGAFGFGNVMIDAVLVVRVVGYIPRMIEIDVRAKPVLGFVCCFDEWRLQNV